MGKPSVLSSLTGFMTFSPSSRPLMQDGTIILLTVQPFDLLILAGWPQVVPLSAASTLALGRHWHLAYPARWEEWAPDSWGCAVAPGRDDQPMRLESPGACQGPQQCPPAFAIARSAARYAPGREEQHYVQTARCSLFQVHAEGFVKPWHNCALHHLLPLFF